MVARHHVGDHHADFLTGGYVQEFIRAMRIGMRTEHTGDQELRLRKLLT